MGLRVETATEEKSQEPESLRDSVLRSRRGESVSPVIRASCASRRNTLSFASFSLSGVQNIVDAESNDTWGA